MTVRTLRDALVGVVYIVVIAALVLLSIMIYNHDFTKYVNVSLRTDNVGSSLEKGSDVKVRGILVGQVNSISTDGNGAVVHLRLTPSKVSSLPANMSAQLLPKTLFGERYVGARPSRRAPPRRISRPVTRSTRTPAGRRSSWNGCSPTCCRCCCARATGTSSQQPSARVALALRGRGAALGQEHPHGRPLPGPLVAAGAGHRRRPVRARHDRGHLRQRGADAAVRS